MRRMIVVAVALMLVDRRGMLAQSTSPRGEVITPQRLGAIADSLPPAASRTAQLGRGEGYTFALTQRDSAGGVEIHMAWTDEFVMQRGSATLVYGGTADGATETTPGELRGGTIVMDSSGRKRRTTCTIDLPLEARRHERRTD